MAFNFNIMIYFIKSNKMKGYQMKCILDELQQEIKLLEAKKWFHSRHKHLSDQLSYNENKKLRIYFNRNFWIESFIYVIIEWLWYVENRVKTSPFLDLKWKKRIFIYLFLNLNLFYYIFSSQSKEFSHLNKSRKYFFTQW
jgi:hypothetical protein